MDGTEREKEIIKELVISEEDVVERLRTLVSKAKEFIYIEDKTGRVIFKSIHDISNSEKILLHLIGRFFAEKIGFIENSKLSMRQISDNLGIPITTISAPLGNLIREGKIEKSNDGLYKIRFHEIENVLDDLLKKYTSG